MPTRKGVPSIREYVQRFLVSILTTKTPDTQRAYKLDLGMFLRWCESQEIDDPDSLTTSLVEDFFRDLQEGGRKLSTILRARSVLTSWAKYVEESGGAMIASVVADTSRDWGDADDVQPRDFEITTELVDEMPHSSAPFYQNYCHLRFSRT